MSALRQAVQLAVELRRQGERGMDARLGCSDCGERHVGLVHVVETWNGKVDGEFDCCKACWIRRGKP